MANDWLDPRTWDNGEFEDADVFNDEVRNQLRYLGGAASRGSGFPTSPIDGQILHLQPDADEASCIWTLKYRQDSNTWDFCGGSPLRADVETEEATTATTYTELATAQRIDVPLLGVYDISIGCSAFGSGSPQSISTAVTSVGFSTPAVEQTSVTSATSGYVVTFSRSGRYTPESGTIAAIFKTAAGTATFRKRWLQVTPVYLSA